MFPAPVAQTFHPGEEIPVTGIYRIFHGKDHQAGRERLLPKGLSFPRCHICGVDVRFSLVRAAPRIFDDTDFAHAA
jgi:hypothetical protein